MGDLLVIVATIVLIFVVGGRLLIKITDYMSDDRWRQ